ncbi:MAG: hypothetical protein ACP59X_12715 [Solidesulfovibrio sp. DCME]|uniref:hypothetical protein n=1 Tax=Solidesulfovibrio sp. DCME TaxID=3447380 RepID=UPI003D134E74
MRIALPLTVLCALAAFWAWASPALAGGDGGRVGGPCRYDTFPGKAVIETVAPWQPSSPMEGIPAPYPPLAVTFTFTPDSPITGEPLYRPGLTHQLTLVNGMPPGTRFARKYGIVAGKAFACELRIIRQGTCTPVLYEFPDIDRADYFELKRP